jgi:Contractile injection system tube protein/LysM domain
MEQVAKALLHVEWAEVIDGKPRTEDIPLQYNPTELSWDKGVQIAEISIPGLDAPLQQFIRGQAEKLTLELFFDTTDEGGMGRNAVSVIKHTDRIYQLLKIEPESHAPPICTFIWHEEFPGSTLNGKRGSASSRVENEALGVLSNVSPDAAETLDVVEPIVDYASGNQRRNGFKCIVESVKQKFTLFSPKGVPLRATLSVTLREYKTLEEQLAHLNLMSPDRTHSHVVQSGETLSSLAARFYQNPNNWRFIADENQIEDPRRLAVGAFLNIPPTQ